MHIDRSICHIRECICVGVNNAVKFGKHRNGLPFTIHNAGKIGIGRHSIFRIPRHKSADGDRVIPGVLILPVQNFTQRIIICSDFLRGVIIRKSRRPGIQIKEKCLIRNVIISIGKITVLQIGIIHGSLFIGISIKMVGHQPIVRQPGIQIFCLCPKISIVLRGPCRTDIRIGDISLTLSEFVFQMLYALCAVKFILRKELCKTALG